jgi:hypothetical protein
VSLNSPIYASSIVEDHVSGIVMNDEVSPQHITIATLSDSRIIRSMKTNQDGSFSLEIDPGEDSLLIYANDPSTPGFDYVPALFHLENNAYINVTLINAASVEIVGEIQSIETENLPFYSIYHVIDEENRTFSPTGFDLTFGTNTTNLLQIPGVQSKTVIVPSNTLYRLQLNSAILTGYDVKNISIITDAQQSLQKGTQAKFDCSLAMLKYNIRLTETTLSYTINRMNYMESLGFYIAKQKTMIMYATRKLSASNASYYYGKTIEGFDEAKISYISLRQTLNEFERRLIFSLYDYRIRCTSLRNECSHSSRWHS